MEHDDAHGNGNASDGGLWKYIGFDNSMKNNKRVGGWDSTLPRDIYEELYFVNENR